MKDKTLIVKKKNVYGNEVIYPVCNKAILFSCIAGTKTFLDKKTPKEIKIKVLEEMLALENKRKKEQQSYWKNLDDINRERNKNE